MIGENACLRERSKGSGLTGGEILRFAQDDSPDPSPVRFQEALSPNISIRGICLKPIIGTYGWPGYFVNLHRMLPVHYQIQHSRSGDLEMRACNDAANLAMGPGNDASASTDSVSQPGPKEVSTAPSVSKLDQ